MKEKLSIDQVAALAMLRLNDGERLRFAADLCEVTAFADAALPRGDAAEVPDTAEGGMREDRCLPPPPREALLASAPAQSDGCILLPITVGEGDAT